jgi:hypothetical protein
MTTAPITEEQIARLRQLSRIVEYATEGLKNGDRMRAILYLQSLAGLAHDLAEDFSKDVV